jgi:hypothetical protein
LYQFITRGFSNRALWSLDYSLAKIILPRLKAYKTMYRSGYANDLPSTDHELEQRMTTEEWDVYDAKLIKEWEDAIDKMILAFDLIVKDKFISIEDFENQQKQIVEGLSLFAKYYRCLED